jgi:hypothetical protein
MPQLAFFDIPVYRTTSDEFYDRLNQEIEAEINPPGDSENEVLRREYYQRDPNQVVFTEEHLTKIACGPWQYNQIVGYIRLLILGSQVRGELWMADAKRYVRNMRRRLVFVTHKVVYEESIPRAAYDEELPKAERNALVLKAIQANLERAKKEMKSLHVDTDLFDKVGKYVDWIGMIEEYGTF